MRMRAGEKTVRRNSKHDWKDVLYIIIFRSSTRRGKQFDIALLTVIFLSVIVILLDSVPLIHYEIGPQLYFLEWVFTILFTIEYILRITVVEKKWKYILSPLGLIDLLSILPAYIGVFYVSYRFLLVLRSLRLLRVFKILELSSFMNAGKYITRALYNSYRKILIFMLFITLLVIIIGSIMYIVEANTPGFESIPNSIYWAVVTITTVGYGDVSPLTPLGKFLSIIVMLSGYSIIAVPTGILTAEMAKSRESIQNTLNCERCGHKTHLNDSRYCNKCGERFPDQKENQ